ncbi:hypothetical protein BJ742DRAFT_872801 [Cladochytrium replicatum]|nr:hypothetical protein BJ742DRAFT_872801 [Cladochytrium replicatum]
MHGVAIAAVALFALAGTSSALPVADNAHRLHGRAAVTLPADALDGQCVTLQLFEGTNNLGYAQRSGSGYAFNSDVNKATAFRLEATALGRYEILDGTAHAYISVFNWLTPGDAYGKRSDFSFTLSGSRYAVKVLETGQLLGKNILSWGAGKSSSTVALATATGCGNADDIDPNVSGTITAGVQNGKIVGLIDMHAHITAGTAFGGQMHCGDAWSNGGVANALTNKCDGHKSLTIGAILENLLGGTSITKSNEHGWKDFSDWPTYNSVLHEQAYYRGIERAYKSGVRVINALLVANRVICDVFPYKDLSCDEMEQIRTQAKYLNDMQDYIDAQSGGAGKGWFRIAKTPAEVRSIAAANKLAVLIGVENSELFNCFTGKNAGTCTTDKVDSGLNELVSLGVSGLFPIHKFDNAFGGTKMDPDTTGAFINIGNVKSAGHWFEVENCTSADAVDQPKIGTNADIVNVLALGIIGADNIDAPTYPTGPVCNTRGLTDLGKYLINAMMKRGMVIHVDHMSYKAASQTLDILEAAKYPGIISEHSWSTYPIINRVLGVGGVVASYPFVPADFIANWKKIKGMSNGASANVAFGLGSDVNGLAVQPPPRADAATNPFKYPFTTLAGTTAGQYVMGTRTMDLNKDGVAEYGLYADWLADNINIAGADGPAFKSALMSSAEAYVSMWEKSRAWTA